MARKYYIFLNGGPGFNSYPESKILAPYLTKLGHKIFFWSETSTLRSPPDDVLSSPPFEANVRSAKSFIESVRLQSKESASSLTIIAHSFSVHYIMTLLELDESLIDELVLISPAFDLHSADLNILRLATEKFKAAGDRSKSDILRHIISKLGTSFDENKERAFLLASEAPKLFTKYWYSSELMLKYFNLLTDQYSFDESAFFRIRKDLFCARRKPTKKFWVPTKIYYGAEDPITTAFEQAPNAADYFHISTVKVLTSSGHYPHIEKINQIFNSNEL